MREAQFSWHTEGSPSSHEGASVTSNPGILLPMQWYGAANSARPGFHATKQLMFAVLYDALRCFQFCVRDRTKMQRQSFAEVETWIADRGDRGPFAFETVCYALGIDPDYLRQGLLEWRRRQLSGIASRRLARRSAKRRLGPLRLSNSRRSPTLPAKTQP